MSSTDIDSDLGRARALRLHLDLARLDYLRLLRRLAETLTAVEIAGRSGTSPSVVSAALREAEAVADPIPGLSGATPFEVAQRYADGQLSRDELVDELDRWPWARKPVDTHPSSAYDDLHFSTPGSFDDIERAARVGLVDGALYGELLDRVAD